MDALFLNKEEEIVVSEVMDILKKKHISVQAKALLFTAIVWWL